MFLKTASKTTAKKDTQKEPFYKPELARTGKRVHEEDVRTRASSFGTCLPLREPAQTHPGRPWDDLGWPARFFWCHFGVILGSFGVPCWCHFGLIFGSWAPDLVMVILRALYVPFRAPIWVSFWGHFWLIFKLENQSGFCTPPGSHFGVHFGLILVLFSD